MKNFVKENWYKLMVGSSMMMASFGFMIYAISPAYSNNNENKVEIPSTQNTNSPLSVNGVIVDDNVYFVSGGFLYSIPKGDISAFVRNEKKTVFSAYLKKYVYEVPTPIKKQLP
ncbi:MAG: hypothetical protein NWR96_08715 [Crocinitomicaceae bacterium]|nr:hypothetical protein [Crocinitomicaceae bacterium]